jgi:hypothetical protein
MTQRFSGRASSIESVGLSASEMEAQRQSVRCNRSHGGLPLAAKVVCKREPRSWMTVASHAGFALIEPRGARGTRGKIRDWRLRVFSAHFSFPVSPVLPVVQLPITSWPSFPSSRQRRAWPFPQVSYPRRASRSTTNGRTGPAPWRSDRPRTCSSAALSPCNRRRRLC